MTDTELQHKRLIAAAIDVGIAIGLSVVMMILMAIANFISTWLGGIVLFVGMVALLGYILLRDVISGDRSLGKKTQELKVVTTGNTPVALMDSVKRNAIFGIGTAFCVLWALVQFIPVVNCLAVVLLVLGWLANLAAGVIEVVKIIQGPAGIRLGDEFAGTRVIRERI